MPLHELPCSSHGFPLQSIPGESKGAPSPALRKGNPPRGTKAFHSGLFVAGLENGGAGKPAVRAGALQIGKAERAAYARGMRAT